MRTAIFAAGICFLFTQSQLECAADQAPKRQIQLLHAEVIDGALALEDSGGARDAFRKPGGISQNCQYSFFEEYSSTGAVVVTRYTNAGSRLVITLDEEGADATVSAVNSTGSIAGSFKISEKETPQAYRWNPTLSVPEELFDARTEGYNVESRANVLTDTFEAAGKGTLFFDEGSRLDVAVVWNNLNYNPQIIIDNNLSLISAVSRGNLALNGYYAGKFAATGNPFIKRIGTGGVAPASAVPGGAGITITGLLPGGQGIGFKEINGRAYRVSPSGATLQPMPPALPNGVTVVSLETNLINNSQWYLANAVMSDGSREAYMNVLGQWYRLTDLAAGSAIPSDARVEKVAGWGTANISGVGTAVCVGTTNRLGTGDNNAAVLYFIS